MAKTYGILDILNDIASKSEKNTVVIFVGTAFVSFEDYDDCLKYLQNETWVGKLMDNLKIIHPFNLNCASQIKVATMIKFINDLQLEDLNVSFIKQEDKVITSVTQKENFIQCQNMEVAKEITSRINHGLRDRYVTSLMRLHNNEMFKRTTTSIPMPVNYSSLTPSSDQPLPSLRSVQQQTPNESSLTSIIDSNLITQLRRNLAQKNQSEQSINGSQKRSSEESKQSKNDDPSVNKRRRR